MLLAIPFGLAIGMCLGTLGGGGSILAVPILVYALGQTTREATTTSLIIVTIGALTGAIGHARHGNVCWRHAAAFTTTALPGIILGTALGDHVTASTLITIFALIMLAAAVATYRQAGGRAATEETAASHCPPLRLARDLTAGLSVGLVIGFFGVGGGFLIVPTLTIALTLAMPVAIGTSLIIITTTSTLGLAVHLLAGRSIDLPITTTLTITCAIGTLAGATISRRLPHRHLSQAFAGLLTVIAAYLLISVALLGGPPAG